MRSCCRWGAWPVLVVVLAGCRFHAPTRGADHEPCRPPRLTVVGHGTRGAVPVRPGQTLHLVGRDYTDACAPGGTGRTLPRLQLVLQARYHAGAVATVRPHGLHSSFTAAVTIPAGTGPGPATITDLYAAPHGVVRLVVRR